MLEKIANETCFGGLTPEIDTLAEKAADDTGMITTTSCDTRVVPAGPTLMGEVISNDLLLRTIGDLKKGVLPPTQWLMELLQLSAEFNKTFTNVVVVPQVDTNVGNDICDIEGVCFDTDLLNTEHNVVVVGDLHGQFRDLMAIFDEVTGMPSADITYIFNGDLVDRGDMSVEILIAVLLAQQLFREKVVILRGNHETEALNHSYGFLKEVTGKYNNSVVAKFDRLFRNLPVAAVIHEKIFVVHGGLGPKTHQMTIEQINGLFRFSEPVMHSPIYELLWSGKPQLVDASDHSFRSYWLVLFMPCVGTQQIRRQRPGSSPLAAVPIRSSGRTSRPPSSRLMT